MLDSITIAANEECPPDPTKFKVVGSSELAAEIPLSEDEWEIDLGGYDKDKLIPDLYEIRIAHRQNPMVSRHLTIKVADRANQG